MMDAFFGFKKPPFSDRPDAKQVLPRRPGRR